MEKTEKKKSVEAATPQTNTRSQKVLVTKKSISSSGKFWIGGTIYHKGMFAPAMIRCDEEMFETVEEGSEINVPNFCIRQMGTIS